MVDIYIERGREREREGWKRSKEEGDLSVSDVTRSAQQHQKLKETPQFRVNINNVKFTPKNPECHSLLLFRKPSLCIGHFLGKCEHPELW
jgi:hypothetical protein